MSTFGDAIARREAAERLATDLDAIAHEAWDDGSVLIIQGTRRYRILLAAAEELRRSFAAGEDEGARRAHNSEGRI